MRERLLVAAMVPEPIATEINGLRRAVGDAKRTRIGPHITLVPPVNLSADDAAAAVDHCRVVAADHLPLSVSLGPLATFEPVNPVVYLAVTLTPELAALRSALHDGPLARLDRRPFVPHVTVNARCAPERIPALMAAMADYAAEVVIGAVEVLEFVDGRWERRECCPLARPTVIGRGGLEVELTEIDDGPSWSVVARHLGEIVGRARGATDRRRAVLWELHHDDRVGDVGAHLLRAFVDGAVRRGTDEVVALDGAMLAGLAVDCGFTLDGGVWTRRL